MNVSVTKTSGKKNLSTAAERTRRAPIMNPLRSAVHEVLKRLGNGMANLAGQHVRLARAVLHCDVRILKHLSLPLTVPLVVGASLSACMRPRPHVAVEASLPDDGIANITILNSEKRVIVQVEGLEVHQGVELHVVAALAAS